MESENDSENTTMRWTKRCQQRSHDMSFTKMKQQSKDLEGK